LLVTLVVPSCDSSDELAADGFAAEPFPILLCPMLGASGFGIALSQEFSKGIVRAGTSCDDETAALYCEADFGSGMQFQDVQKSGRDGQHDRAADFAQVGGVHGSPVIF